MTHRTQPTIQAQPARLAPRPGLGGCRALGRARAGASFGARLGLLMARNKCWTNFPARLIFSNGSTKPDQANTVSAGID